MLDKSTQTRWIWMKFNIKMRTQGLCLRQRCCLRERNERPCRTCPREPITNKNLKKLETSRDKFLVNLQKSNGFHDET